MRWRMVLSVDSMANMVSTRAEKIQIGVPGFMENPLKLWELMGLSRLHTGVLSVKMHPRIGCHITINQVGRMSPSYSRMVSPGPAYL